MKREVRRGRKFIEYHDDAQPAGTFTQEISGADVSYQDEGGSWNPLDESWETDGQDGFAFRAARMNHKVRFDSIGAWRWYPRRNVDTEYIVINRPQCWLTATKRWGNLLASGVSREGKSITITSVRKVTRVIHSRWNGIKTDWVLLDASAPTRFRQKIDLVGITEVSGVLYGADGTRLASLMPTTATDANGIELPCTGSYAGGYVEFSADVTGAAFPVVIDPDFTGGTGDCEVYGQNATYATALDNATSSNNTNNYLRVGQTYVSTPLYRVYGAAILFDTSTIGADSTITQVNLTLVSTADESNVDFNVVITKFNWSAYVADIGGYRTQILTGSYGSTADATWRNTSGMSLNTQYTSGNMATDWVNKTGVTYYGLTSDRVKSETTPDDLEDIKIASGDHTTASYRPKLTVTYTTGGALLKVNMNAQMQNLTGGLN